MPASKKPNKLVVIAVIVIWTLVIGQIVYYGFFNEPKQVLHNSPIATTFTKKEYDMSNSFELLNNYPDPFKIAKQKRSSVLKPFQNLSPIEELDTVVMPDIIYKGIISDGANGKTIFAIAIDQYDYAVRAGETIKGVLVEQGDQDNIKVKVNGTSLKFDIIE